MPEDMPEDMPDHMPEDMPDRMSNRMSEDMSDRMPEDLPVRKCINVMVGITRSKVFFFLICFLISTVNTGLAPWLIFEFVFSLYFVFLKFWVRIFPFLFCIFEIVDSYFFLFCIFEHMHSYFFFCIFTKKYEKHRNKIQKIHFDVQKCNLYFCIFFGIFQSFTDCTLSFCIFFVL